MQVEDAISRSRVLEGKRLAFIGCGVMAEAIIAVLLTHDLIQADQIIGSEPNESRRRELATKYGTRLLNDNRRAIEGTDVVLLTVKPQSLDAVMRELADALHPNQLVISIAPGVTLDHLRRGLRHERVVRSMPNTPSQIGHGATVWTAAPAVEETDRALVATILGAMGTSVHVESEAAVDMATALSGTGPAYIFLVMEALIDAGVHLGFPRRVAEDLVHQTMFGSVLFARESGRHPAELRNMVTTPGGTTAAALYEMERGGLRTVIAKSVWAAYQRSLELGNDTPNGGPDLS